MYVPILLRPKKSEYYPSFIPSRLIKKDFPYSRMGEIIELFKEKIEPIKAEDFNPNTFSETTGVYRFFGTEYYCFTYDHEKKEFVEYIFEKIDNERPWTITYNEEGGEHIHYFEKDERYEILDDSLSYGRFLKG